MPDWSTLTAAAVAPLERAWGVAPTVVVEAVRREHAVQVGDPHSFAPGNSCPPRLSSWSLSPVPATPLVKSQDREEWVESEVVVRRLEVMDRPVWHAWRMSWSFPVPSGTDLHTR